MLITLETERDAWRLFAERTFEAFEGESWHPMRNAGFVPVVLLRRTLEGIRPDIGLALNETDRFCLWLQCFEWDDATGEVPRPSWGIMHRRLGLAGGGFVFEPDADTLAQAMRDLNATVDGMAEWLDALEPASSTTNKIEPKELWLGHRDDLQRAVRVARNAGAPTFEPETPNAATA